MDAKRRICRIVKHTQKKLKSPDRCKRSERRMALLSLPFLLFMRKKTMKLKLLHCFCVFMRAFLSGKGIHHDNRRDFFYLLRNTNAFHIVSAYLLLIMEDIYTKQISSLFHPKSTRKEADKKSCTRYKFYVENEREKVYTYLGFRKKNKTYRQIRRNGEKNGAID